MGVVVVAALSRPPVANRYKFLILLACCCKPLRQESEARSGFIGAVYMEKAANKSKS
jgi:hypothetical protein